MPHTQSKITTPKFGMRKLARLEHSLHSLSPKISISPQLRETSNALKGQKEQRRGATCTNPTARIHLHPLNLYDVRFLQQNVTPVSELRLTFDSCPLENSVVNGNNSTICVSVLMQ